jgi:hypothetical protein
MQSGLLLPADKFASGGAHSAPKPCLAVFIMAVLAQLGLMVALLYVEISAASAASAANGARSSGPQYCILEDPESSESLAKSVHGALAAGCTLVGGASVSAYTRGIDYIHDV